ncbi:diguanylate cyclase (GGDEF)-like protein/PAS domain S-box-containing protein [Rhodoferax ferrireducens]|uniref:Diguanylate cyclase (GGDEF)-like protein/PAS domain S-box-containing protein n=1 Tax=Rhodoferax ferrireducens TaxID=192843 RepID=A0ABU2C3X4_9BURK|nr:EAL domain-containing protein [Rhodoferax ferrireducens]MDR7376009.1 diguanylate cyclase (GGDEF)-like protein/PAS domain S-box-containing protein [Rhodoferax ferrireducens]
MPDHTPADCDLPSLQRWLQHLPVPVRVKDGQGRCLFRNQAFEALFGSDVPPAGPDNLAHDAQVFAHGNSLETEATLWSARHGGPRQVHSLKTPLYDAAGQPQFLLEVLQDISERKQEQAALQANDQRFRDLVDFTDGIVWEADATTFNNSFISKSAERLLGYPLADWLTPNFWANHIYPEDRAQAMQYSTDCIARGEDHEFEYRFVTQDGRVVWIHDSTKIAMQDGKPKWLRGLMVDITARHQEQQLLRVSHQSLKAISQGVVIADPQQRIVSVNDAFTTITGYQPDEALGQTWNLLQGPDTSLQAVDAMRMNMAYGSHYYGDILHYRKDGSSFWNELTVSPVRDAQGALTHFIGVIRDNTKRHQNEEEIRRLAFFDALTGLPNRRLLLDRLRHAQLSTTRTLQHAAVLFLDLDNFKQLNDTLGHDVGDVLLQQVADRLTSCVREGDSVARLGGDEFVLLLESLSSHSLEAAAQAEMVASKILQTLGQPYTLGAHSHHSTPSIGIVVFVKDQESIDELLKKADIAMYQAKAAGRNVARFYEPAMQAAAAAHVQLEKDLRLALARGEFVLHYQIQVETNLRGDARTIGTEALVRWQHPTRGLVPPAAFIPAAEETGLILPLGQWVLETACAQLVAWAGNPETAHWTVAVNVSAAQFSKANFASTVRTALDSTGANPSLLKLELTESMLMQDVEEVIAKMNEIKAYGVRLALDDFGTGYSSLSYLKRLPLSQLKIDKSFVRDLLTDSSDAIIARTIVALGHSLGLRVVAEGVENIGQHDFLADIGCDAYQGYYFGRPVPASQLAVREAMPTGSL